MIKRYKRKPIIIEAIQYLGNNFKEVEEFVGQTLLHYETIDEDDFTLGIPTLEGIMRASVGDYIIKGIRGEFYPCKPDIFKSIYEVVNDH